MEEIIATEIDPQTMKELIEIAGMLADIRKRTGFGRVMIILKYNEIHDIEVTYSRKPFSGKPHNKKNGE
jgi:hypothetical protein